VSSSSTFRQKVVFANRRVDLRPLCRYFWYTGELTFHFTYCYIINAEQINSFTWYKSRTGKPGCQLRLSPFLRNLTFTCCTQ
jgi:hypothetical protein